MRADHANAETPKHFLRKDSVLNGTGKAAFESLCFGFQRLWQSVSKSNWNSLLSLLRFNINFLQDVLSQSKDIPFFQKYHEAKIKKHKNRKIWKASRWIYWRSAMLCMNGNSPIQYKKHTSQRCSRNIFANQQKPEILTHYLNSKIGRKVCKAVKHAVRGNTCSQLIWMTEK